MVSQSQIKHLIAGPCSAETREQVLAVAKEIKEIDELTMFRAGVWKPRTRPNSFEGIGEEALLWLKDVKAEYGLPITTEVATPEHVEASLNAGLDALWIGARTTVNPFYVQEIADALEGVDIPVYVKNPISADFGLWVGAIERLKKSGIKTIHAIHRGFFSYNQSIYRNPPLWDLPVKLKATFPEMDVICDPSHITGNSTLIEDVSELAFLHGLDGLMIETHPNPKEAWSDAAQQVTPSQLKLIIDRLKNNKPLGNIEHDDLTVLRNDIGLIDQEILDLLSQRLAIVEQAAKLKKEKLAAYFQLNRWKTVLSDAKKNSDRLNLDENFIDELMNLIHKESLKLHQKVYNKE